MCGRSNARCGETTLNIADLVLFACVLQVRDYSGTYTVKMVPCIASPNGEFSIPPVCHPREPLTFDMDIRFQQVSLVTYAHTIRSPLQT